MRPVTKHILQLLLGSVVFTQFPVFPVSEALPTPGKPPLMSEVFPNSEDDSSVPACLPNELNRLKAEVFAIAGNRNPSDAWMVVETMLCAPEGSFNATLNSHKAKKIETEVWKDDPNDVGATEIEYIDASSVGPLGQKAWQANVKKEGSLIEISHLTAPKYCVGAFSLDFNDRIWWLVRKSDLCI